MKAKDVCDKVKANKKILFDHTIKKMIDRIIDQGGSCTFDRQIPSTWYNSYSYINYISFDSSHTKKLTSLGFKVEDSSRQVYVGTKRVIKKPEIYRFFLKNIPAEYETVDNYETIATTIVSACCRED